MTWLRTYLRKMRDMRAGPRIAADVQDEIHFHLEMEVAKHIAAGMTPEAARRMALRDFGGVERFAEETQETRRIPLLEEIWRDARVGARQLRRTPGFTVVAVITLALAIGANTAIYSVINGVLLAPLPFANADRLVVAWETDRNSGTTREPAAWPDYIDIKRSARTLARVEAVSGAELNLTPDQGEPVRLSGMAVTHGYFDMMGVRPLLGRAFTPDEDRAGGRRVVMLGEAFWRAKFAADAGVLGRTVKLDDVAYEVIGVLPRGADFGLDQVHARAAYHGDYTGVGDVDVWTTLQADEASFPRDTHPFLLLARMVPGTTTALAQTELTEIAAELERLYPVNEGRGVHVEALDDVVFGPVRPALALLVGAVVLVLLVGCVNVAGLLLARGTARTREVAVRTALGAGTGRLARQFATETMLLALLGGAAGIAVAYGGLHALLAVAPADIPRLSDVRIDTTVLLATLGVSVLVGIAFGLVPTLQSIRLNVRHALREGRSSAGREGSRARSSLVVAELAMAVMLLVGATLLMRSFQVVLNTDPGFDASGILKAEFQLPDTRYPRNFAVFPNWKEINGFNAELTRRVAALPGVASVAIAASHPLHPGFTNSFMIPGREADAPSWPEISVRQVSDGYFNTMGVAVTSGRALGSGDDAQATAVATINRAAADLLFAGSEPIGQTISFWGIPKQIVGVVENERIHGITEAVPPAVYIPLAQIPASGVLLVRTSGNPASLADAVRRTIWSVDPALALYGVEPLDVTVANTLGQRRFTMLVVGSFAGLAILLALIGVHGMLSYTTAQRTREFGIRLALGATRQRIQLSVVRGGLLLAAAGVALGTAGAFIAGRSLASLLYGIAPWDPITFVAVTIAVLAAAAGASWLPARRATRAQALEALRAE